MGDRCLCLVDLFVWEEHGIFFLGIGVGVVGSDFLSFDPVQTLGTYVCESFCFLVNHSDFVFL